jgi:hypothetical protein
MRAAQTVRAQPFGTSQHPWCSTSHLQRRCYADSNSDKAHPFEGYYADLLDAPLHSVQPATRTRPEPPPKDEPPKTEKEEQLAKARVVFGSRLAGPVERRKAIDSMSQNIAGVLVPPKPEEPDNCCMSGCVNCVWDRFRDELEEWAEKSAEARARLQAQRAKGQATGSMLAQPGMPGHVATSMNDDGGGSESNWTGADGMQSLGQAGGPDLFANIPVGIREFMKTEKRLKEKHRREGTLAG